MKCAYLFALCCLLAGAADGSTGRRDEIRLADSWLGDGGFRGFPWGASPKEILDTETLALLKYSYETLDPTQALYSSITYVADFQGIPCLITYGFTNNHLSGFTIRAGTHIAKQEGLNSEVVYEAAQVLERYPDLRALAASAYGDPGDPGQIMREKAEILYGPREADPVWAQHDASAQERGRTTEMWSTQEVFARLTQDVSTGSSLGFPLSEEEPMVRISLSVSAKPFLTRREVLPSPWRRP